MGVAADTILASIAGTQSSLTAATLANGDSNIVRNFASTDMCFLDAMSYAATTKGSLRVRSPRLHDNVRGIQFTPGQSPSTRLLSRRGVQTLYSGDNLTLEMSGGTTSETDIMALHLYYGNLGGINARLRQWGDIGGIIRDIKPLEVDVSTPGTAGAWVDTVITTTENLLEANQDYAVLGYVLDVAGGVVGLKGTDTGNLRICGPASTDEIDTSEYFVQMADSTGRPYIPVINAANANNTFVSVGQPTALAAQKVQLILALLAHTV